MAAAGLLALLDDIATLLDDVAVLTKVAAKQTAGVVGDDLALNANQLIGIASQREIPVVLAVAKGSLVNKAILVPAALAISALAPWAILPLLMIGGAYLCYEGVEKLLHHEPHEEKETRALANIKNPAAYEQEKIKGAIRTDFILSAEIVVIALGTAAEADFYTRVMVLSIVAIAMTVGVYGFVALIVKIDDFGLYLATKPSAFSKWLGRHIVAAAPLLLKGISILGTAAMFLVGGGIILHGMPVIDHALHELVPFHEGPLKMLFSLLITAVAGIAAGGLIVALVGALKTAYRRFKPAG
jgi:predicted DNA repair protein MutK